PKPSDAPPETTTPVVLYSRRSSFEIPSVLLPAKLLRFRFSRLTKNRGLFSYRWRNYPLTTYPPSDLSIEECYGSDQAVPLYYFVLSPAVSGVGPATCANRRMSHVSGALPRRDAAVGGADRVVSGRAARTGTRGIHIPEPSRGGRALGATEFQLARG